MESEWHVPRRDWVVQHSGATLAIILGIYLVLGTLYAALIPPWQMFDEPAHYNYVRHVAERGRLPTLQPGDLTNNYLQAIRLWGYLPGIPIDELDYESYQPPLYYILAAGVYRVLMALGVSMPLGLRLFSMLLGLGGIWAGYKLVVAIFSNDPLPALGTAAFAATLPMHVAASVSVDNAVLTRLILNLAIWQLVTIGRQGWTVRRSLLLGALWGLATLSGLSAYAIAGVALVALVWDTLRIRREQGGRFPWRLVGYAALMAAIAALIALPWLLHNIRTYGPADLLGIERHARVVAAAAPAGAPVPSQDWVAWLRATIVTTFESFWGEFGWMTVLLSPGIYATLALASGLVIIYLALYMVDMARRRVHLAPHAARALALVGTWGLLTVLGYLWLSLRVPQLQGRYLFSSLAVWGLACTLGLRKLFHSSPLPILALMAASIVFLFMLSIGTGIFRGFGITALALAMILIGIGHWLYSRAPSTPLVFAYLGLGLLALVALLNYILPRLTPAIA